MAPVANRREPCVRPHEVPYARACVPTRPRAREGHPLHGPSLTSAQLATQHAIRALEAGRSFTAIRLTPRPRSAFMAPHCRGAPRPRKDEGPTAGTVRPPKLVTCR